MTSAELGFLPLLFAGLLLTLGRRPALGVLTLIAVWTVASVGWGQVIPRLHLWPGLLWVLAWGTTLVAIFIIAQPSRKLLRRRAPWILGVVVLAISLTTLSETLPRSASAQILGWGHDNSAHIFLIESNTTCGGLLSACNLSGVNLPHYLIEYPQGFSVTWSTLPGAFQHNGLLNSLNTYLIVYLLMSLALIVFTGWLAVGLAAGSTWPLGSGVLSAFTVAVGVWSHQFWSGFASFLWAALILLAYVVARETGILLPGRIWIGLAIASLTAVFYSHQLLFPFLAVYIIIDFFRYRQQVGFILRDSPKTLACIVSFAALLAILAPRSAQGNSFLEQVTVEAGMEVIPLWVWIPLSIVGGFILFSRTSGDRTALRWSMISSATLFALLAAITLRANGYVSYYPMKLLTFLVLILIAASSAVVVRKPIATRANQAWFATSGLAVLALALLPPLLRYPGFKTAHQGSTPTAMRTLITDLYGGGVPFCAPFVFRATEELPPTVGRVEVYREGFLQHLESRWINQIRGFWDTAAWANEIDGHWIGDKPVTELPDVILTHDEIGDAPSGVLRLNYGDPCSRSQLPAILPLG